MEKLQITLPSAVDDEGAGDDDIAAVEIIALLE
jgi:hypothetical protein